MRLVQKQVTCRGSPLVRFPEALPDQLPFPEPTGKLCGRLGKAGSAGALAVVRTRPTVTPTAASATNRRLSRPCHLPLSAPRLHRPPQSPPASLLPFSAQRPPRRQSPGKEAGLAQAVGHDGCLPWAGTALGSAPARSGLASWGKSCHPSKKGFWHRPLLWLGVLFALVR